MASEIDFGGPMEKECLSRNTVHFFWKPASPGKVVRLPKPKSSIAIESERLAESVAGRRGRDRGRAVVGMMMGSRFKAGPLSIAVPEGAFNKWVDEEVTRVQSRRQAGQPGTSSGGSFNWPKLNALTINDLTSKGREWVDFLGLKSGLQNSYGVTRNTLDIRKRVDENAARYIVSCAGLAKPRETFFFFLTTTTLSVSLPHRVLPQVNYTRSTMVLVCCLL